MPNKYSPKHDVKKRVLPDSITVAAAVATVKDGASYKGTAKKFNMNVMTLKRLIRRGEECLPGFKKSQVFTDKEEEHLADYLLHASRLNYGLPLIKLRELAYEFAKANNKKTPPSWEVNKRAGQVWARSFMDRNSSLSLRIPEPTSLARSSAFNKHTVSTFFEKLKTTIEKHGFTPEKIWNIDETGVTTVHRPSKIIGEKGVKQVAKVISGEKGQLVTVCSAVNACGNQVPPSLILPRVNWQDRMLQGAPPGSAGATHPSGWMNKENFLKYLEHFQKHSKCSVDNKHLLILDNHDSHVNIEIIDFARANGLVLLTLPPHTSHKLQPLDRSVFGQLKTYFNSAASDWMTNNPGKNITIYDIAGLLGKAYPRAFSPANILSGFRVSGIYPFNSDIFGEDEFFSSSVTDRPNIESGTLDHVLLELPQTPPCSSQPDQATQFQPSLTKSVSTFVSPVEVRPFPKAPARMQIPTKGRKRGRCRVLTDTPEKIDLEAEHEKKVFVVKKNLTKKRDILKISKRKKMKGQGKPKGDSSEDDVWEDRSDSFDDNEIFSESENSEVDEDDFFEICNPKIEDFVFVEFEGKKGKTYFVGKVTEVLSVSEIMVNFLRKKKVHFHFPAIRDEGIVSSDSVRKILPEPYVRRGHYNFKLKFPNVSIG